VRTRTRRRDRELHLLHRSARQVDGFLTDGTAVNQGCYPCSVTILVTAVDYRAGDSQGPFRAALQARYHAVRQRQIAESGGSDVHCLEFYTRPQPEAPLIGSHP
jgi:hypothetical protein